MARRIHGLVGPGKGPKLCVGEATRLQAEVNGMKCGKVYATVMRNDGQIVEQRVLMEDGLHTLTIGDWVQFEYDGKSMAICSLRVD